MILSPAKMAELTEMLFGLWTWAKEPCIRWRFGSPMPRGNFQGKGVAHCKV